MNLAVRMPGWWSRRSNWRNRMKRMPPRRGFGGRGFQRFALSERCFGQTTFLNVVGNARAFQHLVEQRLTEAESRAYLSNLLGAGEPFCLDDDALVPEELRAASRVMRNAAYVPKPVRCAAELA